MKARVRAWLGAENIWCGGPTGKIWKGMRCERAIDGRAKRQLLSIGRRGEKQCGTGSRKHISDHEAPPQVGSASINWTIATGSNRTRRMRTQ